MPVNVTVEGVSGDTLIIAKAMPLLDTLDKEEEPLAEAQCAQARISAFEDDALRTPVPMTCFPDSQNMGGAFRRWCI